MLRRFAREDQGALVGTRGAVVAPDAVAVQYRLHEPRVAQRTRAVGARLESRGRAARGQDGQRRGHGARRFMATDAAPAFSALQVGDASHRLHRAPFPVHKLEIERLAGRGAEAAEPSASTGTDPSSRRALSALAKPSRGWLATCGGVLGSTWNTRNSRTGRSVGSGIRLRRTSCTRNSPSSPAPDRACPAPAAARGAA